MIYKNKSTKDKRIIVYSAISPLELEELRNYCARTGLKPTIYIRMAIYDKMKRDGIEVKIK